MTTANAIVRLGNFNWLNPQEVYVIVSLSFNSLRVDAHFDDVVYDSLNESADRMCLPDFVDVLVQMKGDNHSYYGQQRQLEAFRAALVGHEAELCRDWRDKRLSSLMKQRDALTEEIERLEKSEWQD